MKFNISNIINNKFLRKETILFVIINIFTSALGFFAYNSTYIITIYDPLTVKTASAFMFYIGIVFLIIILNFSNKIIRLLVALLPIGYIIYIIINPHTLAMVGHGLLGLIICFILIVFKRTMVFSILFFYYLITAFILTFLIWKNATLMSFININPFLLLYINLLLALLIFRITGARCWKQIEKIWMPSINKEKYKHSKKQNDNQELLKDHIYFTYFICYVIYYINVYNSNGNIDEASSIMINSILISGIAFYQVNWSNLFENPYNTIREGYKSCKNHIKKICKNFMN